MDMWKLLGTVAGLGLLISADVALAECQVSARGAGQIALEQHGQRVSYELRARDAGWEIEGFGWHASAMSWCAGCNPGGVEGAYVWLGAQSSEDPVGEREDLAFTQGVASTWFSGFRGKAPAPDGLVELVTWGGLKAYVRRYRARHADGTEAVFLALVATDDCVRLRMFAAVKGGDTRSSAEAMLPFLRGLELRKSH
jgi:hypothetical protein